MTASTITRPNTTNSYSHVDGSVRIVAPLYVQLQSRGLAKNILNALRSKCAAPAGNTTRPGGISVEHSAPNPLQVEMEQRLGVSLHILRDILFSKGEGIKLDLILRIQKELDFVFIDSNLVKQAQEASLNHFLAWAQITPGEFKKLTYNYSNADDIE